MERERTKTALAALMALAVLCYYVGPVRGANGEANGVDLLMRTGEGTATIAQMASPSVVSVQIEKIVKAGEIDQNDGDNFENFFEKQFKRFFNQRGQGNDQFFRFQPSPRKELVQGLGSGFIV
jgi:S1-C subfamily serine protease